MNDAPTVLTILVTQGDPGGIGPEIVARVVQTWERPADCRLIVVGFPAHFMAQWPAGAAMPEFAPLEAVMHRPAEPGVLWAHPGPEALNESVELGRPTTRGGQAAARCIEVAIVQCLRENADAICTAPISKEGLRAAGYPFPGHTEFLAQRANAGSVAMMLVGGGLRVVLATIHEALANVPGLISKGRLVELFHLIQQSMPDFGLDRPRIGVAGLNPHCGEGGIFGKEEELVIAPAIQAAHSEGIDVSGPWAGDTLFHRMLQGEFDVVVAMYHDQGLVPVKTLDFHQGINITLGLPFIRTSPDHGTAYSIAGQGKADTRSLETALGKAYKLARHRRARDSEPAIG
jgi:4-hydroxythreonine-4-phosphate dehydrogenase